MVGLSLIHIFLGALKYSSVSQNHQIKDMSNQALAYRAMGDAVLWLMGFCAVMVLAVAKKFRDAGAVPGKAPADSPLTESGVAGL